MAGTAAERCSAASCEPRACPPPFGQRCGRCWSCEPPAQAQVAAAAPAAVRRAAVLVVVSASLQSMRWQETFYVLFCFALSSLVYLSRSYRPADYCPDTRKIEKKDFFPAQLTVPYRPLSDSPRGVAVLVRLCNHCFLFFLLVVYLLSTRGKDANGLTPAKTAPTSTATATVGTAAVRESAAGAETAAATGSSSSSFSSPSTSRSFSHLIGVGKAGPHAALIARDVPRAFGNIAPHKRRESGGSKTKGSANANTGGKADGNASSAAGRERTSRGTPTKDKRRITMGGDGGNGGGGGDGGGEGFFEGGVEALTNLLSGWKPGQSDLTQTRTTTPPSRQRQQQQQQRSRVRKGSSSPNHRRSSTASTVGWAGKTDGPFGWLNPSAFSPDAGSPPRGGSVSPTRTARVGSGAGGDRFSLTSPLISPIGGGACSPRRISPTAPMSPVNRRLAFGGGGRGARGGPADHRGGDGGPSPGSLSPWGLTPKGLSPADGFGRQAEAAAAGGGGGRWKRGDVAAAGGKVRAAWSPVGGGQVSPAARPASARSAAVEAVASPPLVGAEGGEGGRKGKGLGDEAWLMEAEAAWAAVPVESKRECLGNVLLAIAARFPDVGYCQVGWLVDRAVG